MKCRRMEKQLLSIQRMLFIMAITLYVTGCKDSEKRESNVPYDPGKPVEITEFTPKSGGANSRLVIYGENFGTDPNLIKVSIGGKDAKIINVLENCLYCIVAPQSYKGDIKLTVGEGEHMQSIVATEKFIYERQMEVTTLCGYVNDKGNYEVYDGPFSDCGGFAGCTWFSFDPKDHRYLYIAQDNKRPLRMLDLEKEYVYTVLPSGSNGMDRMRTITWTVDGDTMVIANDQSAEEKVNNSYLVRETVTPFGKDAFKKAQTLQVGKNSNGSAIHPINGELYYNSYDMGEVFKFDYWKDPTFSKKEKLFNIQDKDWEFNIQIHPTGDYAYIVVINRHYIMRTDYNKQKKSFGTPYLVCGKVKSSGWEDKVGDQARLNSPYQGIFVKNKEYEKDGKEDIYDFYFCDRDNHCIRILTPEGNVTTFAGRGSLGVNSKAEGYINGKLRDEARFDQPCAIAYDEKTETFYIGDYKNRRIRKIALEAIEEEAIEDTTEGKTN